MKQVEIDGQKVLIFKGRGLGDGGVAVRYLVEENDGTYSEVGHFYFAPEAANLAYDNPGDDHIRWNIAEARRQTLPKDQRPPQAPLIEAKGLSDAVVQEQKLSAKKIDW